MNDTIKAAIISSLITALITTLTSILIFFLGNFSTQATLEKKTIETLSEYFDSVNKDMSYKQGLQTIYEESKQKEEEIGKLNQKIDSLNNKISNLNRQNTNLQNQILNIPNFELKNPALILDGLKIQDSVNKSLIIVDNNNYYSENILNLLLENKLSYNSNQNIVFYNTNGENISTETKIDLFDTNVLYDGTCYGIYLPSDGKTFSMGSSTYNKGFVIYDDHSLFGDGDGYALFDLKGKYSKIAFDVGRTNEYEKEDVVLKVYLNNEYIEEYSLNAQSPPIPLEIDLKYVNNMKLEIKGGSRVKYGFANVILYY